MGALDAPVQGALDATVQGALDAPVQGASFYVEKIQLA